MKQPINRLSPEEKLRIARETAAAAKEKARLKEQAYFESISTGSKWRLFTIFSIYCAALAVLITVETLVDGRVKYLTENERTFYEGAINVEDDWYFPEYEALTGFIDTTMTIVYSPLFDAPKSLEWTSKYQDSKTPLEYRYFYTWRYNSVYSFFPFIQFMLLIPLFMVFYKRPSPLFKFGRMLSIVLIFPASIYLLFVTFGIVNLLPVNF